MTGRLRSTINRWRSHPHPGGHFPPRRHTCTPRDTGTDQTRQHALTQPARFPHGHPLADRGWFVACSCGWLSKPGRIPDQAAALGQVHQTQEAPR